MAVPKSKITPSRRGMRRSHDALSSPAVSFDKETGEAKRPHHVSLVDGTYKGRKIFLTREEKRQMKREAEAAAAEESDTKGAKKAEAPAVEEKKA